MLRRMPINLILKSEALAALAAGIAIWVGNDGSLWLLVPALLLPDLSMVGYLNGPRLGALTYNAAHNWTIGIAVLGIGWWLAVPGVLLAGAILVAHVGMDRALGYGLKLPTAFEDTHLGRIGREGRRRPGA
jgi:Domain of unknown function (DUF4260)